MHTCVKNIMNTQHTLGTLFSNPTDRKMPLTNGWYSVWGLFKLCLQNFLHYNYYAWFPSKYWYTAPNVVSNLEAVSVYFLVDHMKCHLWIFFYLVCCCILWTLELKNVCRGKVWWVWRMSKHSDLVYCAIVAHQQNVHVHFHEAGAIKFLQDSQYILIVPLINSLSLWHNSWWTNPSKLTKTINMALKFELSWLHF